ncbi:MAG: hypothetical protein R3B45_13035 [Bdellovibrionota bacterium]
MPKSQLEDLRPPAVLIKRKKKALPSLPNPTTKKSLTAASATTYCYAFLAGQPEQREKANHCVRYRSLPDFTLYDDDHDVENKTNTTTVRATIASCTGIDAVLFTKSSTKPAANDAGFTTCSEADKGLNATPLTAQAAGLVSNHSIYLWVQKNGVVSPKSASVTLVYDTKAPTGSAQTPRGNATLGSIDLELTHPSDSDYATVEVYHKFDAGGGCTMANKNAADDKLSQDGNNKQIKAGPASPVDVYVFKGYSPGDTHCYKTYFIDDVGNEQSIDSSFTLDEFSTCQLNSPADNSNRYKWYLGSTASFVFGCDGTITAAENANADWPSYLSLEAGLPANSFTLSGTTSGISSDLNWSVKIKGISGVTDADLSGLKSQVIAVPAANDSGYSSQSTQASPLSVTDATKANESYYFNFDQNYAGTNSSIKVLLSSSPAGASTSNGSADASDSDIPGLVYSDTSSTCDAAPTVPTVCAEASTFSASTFSPDNPAKVSTSTNLYWDYDWYDHGEYLINTRDLLTIDGLSIEDHEDTVFYQTANITAEESLILTTPLADPDQDKVGSSAFFGDSNWAFYSPSVAINESLSSNQAQVVASRFSAVVSGDESNVSGIFSLDRTISSGSITGTYFFHDLSTAPKYSTSNILTSAMVSAEGDEWLSIESHQVGKEELNLASLKYNSGSPNLKTIRLDNNVADFMYNVDITEYFDDSGTKRHGIVFFADADAGNGDVKKFMFLKFYHNPQPLKAQELLQTILTPAIIILFPLPTMASKLSQ